MSLAKAKVLIAQVEQLQKRANKLRNKQGRLEISREMLADLNRLTGSELEHTEKPDGTISVSFSTFVAAADAAVEAFGL